MVGLGEHRGDSLVSDMTEVSRKGDGVVIFDLRFWMFGVAYFLEISAALLKLQFGKARTGRRTVVPSVWFSLRSKDCTRN